MDGESGEADIGRWLVWMSVGGATSGYAGTTLFLRLIVDFFMATGLCEPCNLWYNPLKCQQPKFRGTTSNIPHALQIG